MKESFPRESVLVKANGAITQCKKVKGLKPKTPLRGLGDYKLKGLPQEILQIIWMP